METTIKFLKTEYLGPAEQVAFGFLYWYIINTPESTSVLHAIAIRITDIVNIRWGLFGNAGWTKNAESQLRQYAINEINDRYKEGSLKVEESVLYYQVNVPNKCPYSGENVPIEFVIK